MSSQQTPAALRNAFLNLLEEDRLDSAACELTAQLLTCSDELPQEYCDILELPPGTTFADAAQRVRETLGCAN